MAKFETVTEGANKLWIKTPFPITRNAWGFLMLRFFPGFSIDIRLKGALRETCWPENQTVSRWEQPEHRYLSRKTNPNGSRCSAITDGEYGAYWTHATLPDDRRQHMFQDEWGVVYIPHPAQYSYLDRLRERFQTNDLNLYDVLVGYSRKEKQIVEELSDQLQCALNDDILNTSRKVRNSVFPEHKDLPFQNFPETSHYPANNLPRQTRLDFCRKLNDALTKDINGENTHPDFILSNLDKGRIEYQMLGAGSAYWNILRSDIPQPTETNRSELSSLIS